jgi:two-component system response regulator
MDVEDVEILLVEDSPSDAELTMRALKQRNLGNRVVHVEDGVKALDFVFGRGEYAGRDVQKHPKVILLDLKLPRMNGFEVLRQLKADAKTENIPVVVLTSSTEERDVVESYRLGVNSFITKPVDFNKFLDAVSELGFYWLLLNRLPSSHRAVA